jgi:hypothetical protein
MLYQRQAVHITRRVNLHYVKNSETQVAQATTVPESHLSQMTALRRDQDEGHRVRGVEGMGAAVIRIDH